MNQIVHKGEWTRKGTVWKNGQAAPLLSPWTEREELELVWLKAEPISIWDTAIAWLKSNHTWEMTTFKAMVKEEKVAFLKELQDDVVKVKEGSKDEQEALI